MFARLRSFWTPPILAGDAAGDHARLTFLIARLLLPVSVVTVGVVLLHDTPNRGLSFGFALLWSIGFVTMLELARRGRSPLAAWLLPGWMLVGIPLVDYLLGARLDVLFGGVLLAAAVATLLLNQLGTAIFSGIGMCVTLAYFVAERAATAGATPSLLAITIHVALLGGLLFTSVMVIAITAHQLRAISQRDRRQAEQLSVSHRELDTAISTLRLQAASLQHANALLAQEIAERQRIQSTLQTIVHSTASVTGHDFMAALSLELVRALGVRYVVISEVLDDGASVRTLTYREYETLCENITYALKGTPCEVVITEQRTIEIEQGVQRAYPRDELLQTLHCESYYGEPLLATAPGAVLGHLALLDVKRLHLTTDQRALLKMFADRTAAELERDRAVKALQAERATLAERVDERAAELVYANRELSRALQARTEFLANVSHELRTPLNAIIGLTDALAEGVYGGLSERQAKSLATVNQSGRQLLNVINDILDVAKLETDRVVLQPVSILIDELCRASIDMVRADAEAKGIRIEYRRDARVTAIRADGIRLKQILVNLLSNAVKFTNPHGGAGLVVTLREDAGTVEFTVWDTGIGIAAEDIDRLFQPFVQIDGRLNRRYGGTGLGLVIVKRLAEMHKGTISVQSVVGQGSQFVVSLPLVQTLQRAVVTDLPPG